MSSRISVSTCDNDGLFGQTSEIRATLTDQLPSPTSYNPRSKNPGDPNPLPNSTQVTNRAHETAQAAIPVSSQSKRARNRRKLRAALVLFHKRDRDPSFGPFMFWLSARGGCGIVRFEGAKEQRFRCLKWGKRGRELGEPFG